MIQQEDMYLFEHKEVKLIEYEAPFQKICCLFNHKFLLGGYFLTLKTLTSFLAHS